MKVRGFATALVALCGLAAAACGAKTGLKIPDSGPDGAMCTPGTFDLERRGAEVLFVLDRSGSMELGLDGSEPGPGVVSRWSVLVDALETTLPRDDLMQVGAKLFPQAIGPTEEVTHDNGCMVLPVIELEPATRNVPRLITQLREVTPRGGTPTFETLQQARDYLVLRPLPPGVARFMILATDGGPNCNPDTGVDPTVCVCTTERDDCGLSPAGPFNCLDDSRTLSLMDEIHRASDIPIYVIGIDNLRRLELTDVLERMAIAGGRPREVAPGEPSYYSVREPADLAEALETISGLIAECVFQVDSRPPTDRGIQITVGGAVVPQDRTHTSGWDWTDRDRGELSLFGDACDRATAGFPVGATVSCETE
jgi:hypothetical protein